MINLLPDETKQQIKAAHANTVIGKCLIFALFGTLFVVAACTSAYYLSVNTKPASDTSNGGNTTQADNNEKYSSLVDSVLSQQVSYSNIITSIGSALPNGVSIESLSISNELLKNPLTFSAHAEKTANIDEINNGSKFTSNPLFSNYLVTDMKTNRDGSSSFTISININKGVTQ